MRDIVQLALVLNDVCRLASGCGPGRPAETAEAAELVLRRIRGSFTFDQVGYVLELAMEIDRSRALS